MAKADGNPGLSKLARVMSNRMREFQIRLQKMSRRILA